MVEPFSALFGVLISELARGGFEAYFEHRESRPAAPVGPMMQPRPEPVSIIDLTTNNPVAVRATVNLSVTTVGLIGFNQLQPYWALFGVQAAEGAPRVTPVLYREPVELRVAPGQYGLSALFLTKPASFGDKPFLVAVGYTHEVLASSRVQRVALSGSPPTAGQIQQLKARQSGKPLPFRLAASAALPARPQPAIPNVGRPIFGSPARPQSAILNVARPVFGSPARPQSAILNVARPVFGSPARPQPAIPNVGGRVFPPSERTMVLPWPCQARNAGGHLCGQPVPIRRINLMKLCSAHLTAVQNGEHVVWHSSGLPIRLSGGSH
jgi:hypothetical protein